MVTKIEIIDSREEYGSGSGECLTRVEIIVDRVAQLLRSKEWAPNDAIVENEESQRYQHSGYQVVGVVSDDLANCGALCDWDIV